MTDSQVCLARNMYWEVRRFSLHGMLDVSHVVIERMLDKRYPKTVCGVVEHYKQRRLTLNKCQFSWFCDGKSDTPIKNELDVYMFALTISGAFLNSDCGQIGCMYPPSDLEDATVYHSVHISPPPTWDMAKLTKTYEDEYHVFYIEN